MTLTKLMMSAALVAAGLSVSMPAQAGNDVFIGEVSLVGFNFCPRGTMEADGKLLQISKHQALFSLYGTMYGGDGRTTFALPDLRGRTVIHEGQGAGLSSYLQGQRGGMETLRNDDSGRVAPARGKSTGPNIGTYNMQPFLVMKYCVATQGTYPSRS